MTALRLCPYSFCCGLSTRVALRSRAWSFADGVQAFKPPRQKNAAPRSLQWPLTDTCSWYLLQTS